jgi:hypothetical protein
MLSANVFETCLNRQQVAQLRLSTADTEGQVACLEHNPGWTGGTITWEKSDSARGSFRLRENGTAWIAWVGPVGKNAQIRLSPFSPLPKNNIARAGYFAPSSTTATPHAGRLTALF